MKQDKSYLRSWAKQVRKGLNKNSLLISKLKKTKEYMSAKRIMLFYPMNDEVDLLPLLEDKTKEFFLPKVDGENLLCCPYRKGDELCLSCFNTQEPVSQPINPQTIDLVIVPALVADENNYRLGYGGGFYDRFLSGLKVTKVVCIPKELLIETINPEKYDIPVDIVITD